MRFLKSYEENQKEDEIFRYVAAGNNRDGLAFRAAGHLAEKSEKSKKYCLYLRMQVRKMTRMQGKAHFTKTMNIQI